jgi:hypothetical protein
VIGERLRKLLNRWRAACLLISTPLTTFCTHALTCPFATDARRKRGIEELPQQRASLFAERPTRTGRSNFREKIIGRHMATITSRAPSNRWRWHEMRWHEYLTAGAKQGWPDKECADSCRMTSVLGVPKMLFHSLALDTAVRCVHEHGETCFSFAWSDG